MLPNAVVESMFKVGLAGAGWFRRFVASTRTLKFICSWTWNDLLMEVLRPHTPGFWMTFWPRLPRVPGFGFCRTMAPEVSAMALSVHRDFNVAAICAHW